MFTDDEGFDYDERESHVRIVRRYLSKDKVTHYKGRSIISMDTEHVRDVIRIFLLLDRLTPVYDDLVWHTEDGKGVKVNDLSHEHAVNILSGLLTYSDNKMMFESTTNPRLA